MSHQSDERWIWVFVGEGARFPAGVFSTREAAADWIQQGRFTGTLTAYPLDEGTWEWAIRLGYFVPKRDSQTSAAFRQQFSSASQPHFHFTEGEGETNSTGD